MAWNKRRKRRRKKNTRKPFRIKLEFKYSKVLVFTIILLNLWFANRVLLLFEKTEKEPTGMIAAWSVIMTTELWNLVKIKINDKAADQETVKIETEENKTDA